MIQVFQNLLTKPDATATRRITDFITIIVTLSSSEHTQALFQAL